MLAIVGSRNTARRWPNGTAPNTEQDHGRLTKRQGSANPRVWTPRSQHRSARSNAPTPRPHARSAKPKPRTSALSLRNSSPRRTPEKRRRAAAQHEASPSLAPTVPPCRKPPSPTPKPNALDRSRVQPPQPRDRRRATSVPRHLQRRHRAAAPTERKRRRMRPRGGTAARRGFDDQPPSLVRRSLAGLAENAKCGNAQAKIVNEGYLRSTLAAAEHELGIGDWRADLKRANALLARCQTMPELKATRAPADCLAQRRFNERAAAEFSLPATPSPSADDAPRQAEPAGRSRTHRGARARGGIGRRAGFRFQWGDPSEFESRRAHVSPPNGLDAPRAGPVHSQGSSRGPRIVVRRSRGSSSAVEHRLAKARVASSNLVFRSISI